MKPNEIRYRMISTLLQAGEPLTLAELLGACGVTEAEAVPLLQRLIGEGLVVEGALSSSVFEPQYCWRARWEEAAQRRNAAGRQTLRTSLGAIRRVPISELDVDSELARVFHEYVVNEYKPPRDKRYLVILQCSVRRPFSASPSHASMRRAISTATGYDPRKDRQRCPVHVVVLASKIGPVPYELEDVYPANARCGGVKHFSPEAYARVRPILAERMADYLVTHRCQYERIATFTEGRYAEVMRETRDLASVRCGDSAAFPILPRSGGPQVRRIGRSSPRQYWARYWIQLYLEIESWLEPSQRAEAKARLRKMQVDYGQ